MFSPFLLPTEIISEYLFDGWSAKVNICAITTKSKYEKDQMILLCLIIDWFDCDANGGNNENRVGFYSIFKVCILWEENSICLDMGQELALTSNDNTFAVQ